MLWLENLFSQAMVERLGWMLVHFLWQAMVVAILLAAFLCLLRKSSANLRYTAACSALAMIVVLPVVTIRFIKVVGPAAEAGPLPVAAPAIAPPTEMQTVDEIVPLSQTPDSMKNVNPARVVPWNERIALALRPTLPYAVLGWLVGVFGLSAWHLGGWMQLQRLKRHMVRAVGAVLHEQAAELSKRLGVFQAVTLLESALVEVPTVVGWLRPVILLPASALTGLSPGQLEAVLAHELAHIRRHDYLVNMLQTIVEILGFYHPAIWWVSRRIRIERENCCDDVAVHICGDSVRYARALTCLEEIRHSHAELAMAATGGSLLDRIARLLGRPATDDRRFAWLPGLIALLLVVGIVVPTALALATPNPRLPESPSDVGVTSADEAQDETEPNEPPRTHVLIRYTLIEVSANRTLDPETAAEARTQLLRRPAGNPDLMIGSVPQPSIEELRRPLWDVLANSMLARGKDKEFTDLLISRGYARAVAKPGLQMFVNQQATVEIGAARDPNAPEPREPLSFMRLEAKAHVPGDSNTVVMETDLTLTYPADGPGDPNGRVTTTQIVTTSRILDNGYAAIIERNTAHQNDEGACSRLHILLIQPTIHRPPVTSSGEADELPASEPNAPNADLRIKAAGEPNAAEADKAQVQVDVKIVRAVGDSEMDRDTILRIEKILGKRVRPEGRAGEFGPRLHLTAHDILRDHVVQQALPAETLDALLPLFRDLEVLSSPRVLARDGMKCQIKVVNDEYVYTVPSADGSSEPGKLERVEAGTKVDLTPHIGDHNEVTLDIIVGMTDVFRPTTDANTPVVTRRTTQATVTMLSGECVTIGGMTDNGTAAEGKDALSVYIMASPTIVKAPAGADDTNEPTLGMGGMGGFRIPSGEVDARAFADPAANDRWMMLRTQYVNSDPLYRELARRIVQIEHELIADGQTFTPQHPQMVRKRALLDALRERMEERKKSLEQEFENQTTETRRVRLKNLTAERAQSHLSMLFPQYVRAEPADRADPNSRDLMVTTPGAMANRVIAEIERIDLHPRYVLLDTRIVTMERRDLWNLGIEWTQGKAHPNVQGSAPESDIHIGRLPERTASYSLTAGLNLLKEDNRVDVLSSPTVIERESRKIRIRHSSEQQYVHTLDPRVHTIERGMGIIFSIVPYVHDNNDISLDIGYSIDDETLRNRDPNSPVARPDAPTSTITVHDGGTAVLAIPEKNTGKAGDSQRMVALFITPSLIDDPAELRGAMDTGGK